LVPGSQPVGAAIRPEGSSAALERGDRPAAAATDQSDPVHVSETPLGPVQGQGKHVPQDHGASRVPGFLEGHIVKMCQCSPFIRSAEQNRPHPGKLRRTATKLRLHIAQSIFVVQFNNGMRIVLIARP
jgi:hypothetical protein